MPTQLDIENHRFEFGDQWHVAFKYDDTVFHRCEATKLQGMVDTVPHSTKAVDVVGIHQATGLHLIEVKDFRGHRIANKPRIDGEVSVEVAVKVRDTVAALVGAARKNVTEFPSGELASAFDKGKELVVVMWLEDETFRDEKRAKVSMHALNQRLKLLLSWLNVRTIVLSSSVPNRVNHLNVTNLPGAGQPNP